ncbi:MAG: ATP-binding response regulator [Bacteroidia bacterium]
MKPIKILFLEDTISDVDLMRHELKKGNIDFESKWVETEHDFFDALDHYNPDVILSDYSLPSFDGMKAFKLLKDKGHKIPFILVTSNMSEQLALDCLSEGVDDFILKSSFGRIPKTLLRAIEKKNIEKEKERMAAELLVSQGQLRELVNELQIVREQERMHIAREIHDELGQQLTALKMDIGWIIHKHKGPDDEITKKLNEMLGLSDGIIDTVRRISSELRPALIDDLGLIAAMEWKCHDFEERMKIDCKFNPVIKERKFESNLSMVAYRILQETLTNIARHAEASKVSILLNENEDQLTLEIIDNGKGVNLEKIKIKRTFGILGMRERALLLGGELKISSAEGKGTHVKLILPLKNEYSNS